MVALKITLIVLSIIAGILLVLYGFMKENPVISFIGLFIIVAIGRFARL